MKAGAAECWGLERFLVKGIIVSGLVAGGRFVYHSQLGRSKSLGFQGAGACSGVGGAEAPWKPSMNRSPEGRCLTVQPGKYRLYAVSGIQSGCSLYGTHHSN